MNINTDDPYELKYNQFNRCSICNYCSATDSHNGSQRRFTHDKVSDEWHCSKCKDSIVSTLEDVKDPIITYYWLEMTERPATDEPFVLGALSLEDLDEAVDPLQARLNAYPEVDDGS